MIILCSFNALGLRLDVILKALIAACSSSFQETSSVLLELCVVVFQMFEQTNDYVFYVVAQGVRLSRSDSSEFFFSIDSALIACCGSWRANSALIQTAYHLLVSVDIETKQRASFTSYQIIAITTAAAHRDGKVIRYCRYHAGFSPLVYNARYLSE